MMHQRLNQESDAGTKSVCYIVVSHASLVHKVGDVLNIQKEKNIIDLCGAKEGVVQEL